MNKFLIILVLVTCSRISRGQVWTDVIDSIPTFGPVQFKCTIVDPNTNILYLAGEFYRLNQFTTSAIVQYDGTSFDTLSTGIDDQGPLSSHANVLSMQMFQDKLHVFGIFKKTGHYWCSGIGRWNGVTWDTLDWKPNGPTWHSDVYNNELYVQGYFDTIGGIATNCVAKFDGTQWHSLSHPIKNNVITAMKNYDGKLYIAGQVTNASSSANLSYWDGTQWVPWVGVAGDNAKTVTGMTVIDSMLYVYGRFNSIAGTNCKGLAAFNGKNWYGFGDGLSNSTWETIYSVQKINGEIYVTGIFDKIEGISNSDIPNQLYTSIAKFDGEKWCLISTPFDNVVSGLITYKNELYSFGRFKKTGTDSVFGFEKWIGDNSTIACSPDVNIIVSPVGLKEVLHFQGLKIFPNPVKQKLTIESSLSDLSDVSIEILNSLGQIVYTLSKVDALHEIDLSGQPVGVYFLKLQSNSDQRVFKIIKEI